MDTQTEQPFLRTIQPNQCPACTMQLASRQSLRRHWDFWHQDRKKEELEEYLQHTTGKRHHCPTCAKTFARPNALKSHQQNIHQQYGLKRVSRFQCPVADCDELHAFYFLKDLLQHCESSHEDQLGTYKINALCYRYGKTSTSLFTGVQSLEFASWDEFQSWKLAEEGRTNTYYIQV